MVCTVYKKYGDVYNDCVLDYLNPGDCTFAIELHDLGKGKHSCKYWVETHDRQPLIDLIARLTQYNEWRRGAEIEQPDPKQLGQDIEDAIALIQGVLKDG